MRQAGCPSWGTGETPTWGHSSGQQRKASVYARNHVVVNTESSRRRRLPRRALHRRDFGIGTEELCLWLEPGRAHASLAADHSISVDALMATGTLNPPAEPANGSSGIVKYNAGFKGRIPIIKNP